MHPRLKNIVFHKLNKDLSKCEIILAENQSIWFIDRDRKYWYFELEKCGKLWWRYEFFTEFFTFFSLEHTSFQRLLSQWVEGILNREVVRINENHQGSALWMDYILSSEVVTTDYGGLIPSCDVEDILNRGVKKTDNFYGERSSKIEEVLNREINEIDGGELFENGTVERLLNPKITETKGSTILDTTHIHEALSRGFVSISPASEKIDFTQQVLVNDLLVKIESATPLDTPAHDSVDEVLSYKVTRTIPDLNESLVDVERLLD